MRTIMRTMWAWLLVVSVGALVAGILFADDHVSATYAVERTVSRCSGELEECRQVALAIEQDADRYLTFSIAAFTIAVIVGAIAVVMIIVLRRRGRLDVAAGCGSVVIILLVGLVAFAGFRILQPGFEFGGELSGDDGYLACLKRSGFYDATDLERSLSISDSCNARFP